MKISDSLQGRSCCREFETDNLKDLQEGTAKGFGCGGGFEPATFGL
jgi:hypothetical protein